MISKIPIFQMRIFFTFAMFWTGMPALAEEATNTVPGSDPVVAEPPTVSDTGEGAKEPVWENTVKRCEDGVDNDDDGHLDCADQDCQVFIICADAVSKIETTDSESEQEPVSPESLGEEEIDLESLEEKEDSPPPTPSRHGHGGGGGNPPKFKLFFDLLTEFEFETKKFQFTRDHAHILLDLSVTDWLDFRTDIAFEPEFFEATFHFKQLAEIRLGKILVPFGQNEFHHLIGGRVDEDGLFLPPIWGEYGLLLKHNLVNGDVISFNYSIWVVNGFQDTTDDAGNPVPSRSDGRLTDNNQMKGVGLRPELQIGESVILGTSWYVDAWDEKNDQFMLYYGVDLELGYGLIPEKVLRDFRLRGEFAWGEVMLPGQNVYHGILGGYDYGILKNYALRRSGYNVELSYRPLRWLTFRYREGWLNDDNRVTDAHDLLIHEPAVAATFGPVQVTLAAQFHQLLKKNPDPPPTEFSKLYLRVLVRY